MNFAILAPLTLVLGVFIGLPIYAHLIRREPKEKLYFGAMMLLRRLEQTKKRRPRRLAKAGNPRQPFWFLVQEESAP